MNLFDEIASDPSDAVTANFPLFTSTSPATSSVLDSVAAPVTFNVLDSVLDSVVAPVTSSVLDSVAAPELRLLNVVPPASSVPATTVLPVLPATVNLFDEIASDPSDAVTANFPLFTSTPPATSSVLDSVAAPVTFNVLDSVVAPVTSSVLDSVAAPELRLLNVVPPASSVPATTVLPVLPATVNLFDEIASDPSDAVTANFPLFTSTSPATSSVLDSVAAPVTFNVLDSVVAPVTSSVLDSVAAPELRLLNVVPPASSVPATTVLPVLPATVNLFDEIASDPSDAVTANFPLFTSTSPATSSVLDSVAAPSTFNVLDSVIAPRHIQRARQRRSSRAQAAQRSPPASSVPATTVLPVLPATVNLFDEIASDPSDAVTANFPLFTSTSPATSSVLDSVAAPVTFNVLDSVVAPVTSSVLDSVAAPELRLLNVVPPASSVPATTVLPVLPATVNLFVWIAKDPSDPDTTNLRAPTAPILTSDTTPSVLDSVVAPPTLSVLSSVAAPITSRVFDIVVVPV